MAMPPLRRLLLGAAVLLVAAITVTYYIFEISRIAQLQETVRERESTLRSVKDNVRSYQEKVRFYQTQEGIEHLAREQYNLVTSGDRMILLTDQEEGQEERMDHHGR